MELLLSEYLTLGNIFLAIVFLLILNQLIELYQFRNMPPGPRLTSLPFIGNLLSFDAGESLREATTRFVYTFPWFAMQAFQLLLAYHNYSNDVASFVFLIVLIKTGLCRIALASIKIQIEVLLIERATVKKCKSQFAVSICLFFLLCAFKTADPPAASRLTRTTVHTRTNIGPTYREQPCGVYDSNYVCCFPSLIVSW